MGSLAEVQSTRQLQLQPEAWPSIATSDSGLSCALDLIFPSSEPVNVPLGTGNAVNDDILSSMPSPPPASLVPHAAPLLSPRDAWRDEPVMSLDETTSAFAAALPSNHSLPTPPLRENIRQLRLPSFEGLGIAAPYSDGIALNPAGVVLPPVGDHSSLTDGGSGGFDSIHPHLPHQEIIHLAPCGHLQDAFGGRKRLFEVDTSVLTPPAEDTSALSWSPFIQASSATADETDVSSFHARGRTDPPKPILPEPPAEESILGEHTWLKATIQAVVLCMGQASFTGNSMRVLSHALPSPSIPGHAYPTIIDSIRFRFSANPIMWINLLHAVPGPYNIADIPTSPPSTPGLPLSGDDYFTTKIFDSAVSAINYDNDSSQTTTRPHPIQPPASLDLSIVERYIPPTSINEFAELFNPDGASLVVDRMVELSPGNGCLVFIYPTRTGGQTFMSEYLCPILDPLLRSLVVVNGFSADLSSSIGRMSTVDNLYAFEIMHQKMKRLCRDMSGSSTNVRERLHGVHSTFSILLAEKQEVYLDRKTWSNWWIKQEKPRVRAAVNKYFRTAKRHLADMETSTTSVIQEVLEGVASKPCTSEPSKKIEVAVFVVQRDK